MAARGLDGLAGTTTPSGPPPGHPHQRPQQGPQQRPQQRSCPQGPGGPPQSQAAPQGYADATVAIGAPPKQSAGSNPVAVLALESVAAVVIGLSVPEDGRNQWHTVNAWGGLAILGALLTLAPAGDDREGDRHRTW